MGVKTKRFEGSPEVKLAQLFKAISEKEYVRLGFGTVTEPLPSIRIAPDNIKFELDADDITLPDHLKDHTVELIDENGVTKTYTQRSPLKVGDRVSIIDNTDGSGTVQFLVLCKTN